MGSPPLLVSMPTPISAVSAATHVVQDTWHHNQRCFGHGLPFFQGQRANTWCSRAVDQTAVSMHRPQLPSPAAAFVYSAILCAKHCAAIMLDECWRLPRPQAESQYLNPNYLHKMPTLRPLRPTSSGTATTVKVPAQCEQQQGCVPI